MAVTTDAGAPVAMAQVVVVQAKVDAPNLGAMRDGTFLPPELRNGGTLMMHMRAAMGGPAVVEEMRPGEYTACAVPLPIGDDPSRARALMEDSDSLPMKCASVRLADGPVRVEIVVPAAWTQPAP